MNKYISVSKGMIHYTLDIYKGKKKFVAEQFTKPCRKNALLKRMNKRDARRRADGAFRVLTSDREANVG